MNKHLLIIFSTAVYLVLTAGTSNANCTGGPQNRRLMVAQGPDLFFVAGTPSTQYIPETWVNFYSYGVYGDDCEPDAYSNLPSVTVQSTYCYWDQVGACPFGPVEPGDISAAPANPPPNSYRNFQFQSAPDGRTGHIRPMAVYYDGTSAAGTVSTIDFVANPNYITYSTGNSPYGEILGQVNVYIISGTPPPTWFTVTAGPTNSSGNSITLNNQLLNGNPGMHMLITHSYDNIAWPHPTAIWYDSSISAWKIRNEDGTPMPNGLTFSVRVDGTAVWIPSCTINRFTRNCTASNVVTIDDPRTNYNPFAVILATPVSWGTTRFTHPLAVVYSAPHWVIINTDGQSGGLVTSANGYGFHVKILSAGQNVDDNLTTDPSGFANTTVANGVGIDINGPYRVSTYKKTLSDFCWTIQGAKPAIVMQNESALPPPAPYNYNVTDPDFFGLQVSGSYMQIWHENTSKTMPGYGAFNIYTDYNINCPPYVPHD